VQYAGFFSQFGGVFVTKLAQVTHNNSFSDALDQRSSDSRTLER